MHYRQKHLTLPKAHKLGSHKEEHRRAALLNVKAPFPLVANSDSPPQKHKLRVTGLFLGGKRIPFLLPQQQEAEWLHLDSICRGPSQPALQHAIGLMSVEL